MNSTSDSVLVLSKAMSRRFEGVSTDVLDHLRALLDESRTLVNCSEAGLLVPAGDGANLRFLLSVNSRAEVPELIAKILVPCERSLAGCVFNTGQTIATANPDNFYDEVDSKSGLKTVVYLAVPLIQGDRILGVVTYMNRPDAQPGQPQRPFAEDEIDAGHRMASLLGIGYRFWQRLEVQQRLFEHELAQAANQFRGSSSWNDFSYADVAATPVSPLEQSLAALERLAPREQGLAARILQVLSQPQE